MIDDAEIKYPDSQQVFWKDASKRVRKSFEKEDEVTECHGDEQVADSMEAFDALFADGIKGIEIANQSSKSNPDRSPASITTEVVSVTTELSARDKNVLKTLRTGHIAWDKCAREIRVAQKQVEQHDATTDCGFHQKFEVVLEQGEKIDQQLVEWEQRSLNGHRFNATEEKQAHTHATALKELLTKSAKIKVACNMLQKV